MTPYFRRQMGLPYTGWLGDDMLERIVVEVRRAAAQHRLQLAQDLDHLWETIYDHGNGKYQGEKSKAQRERAFEIVASLQRRLGFDNT